MERNFFLLQENKTCSIPLLIVKYQENQKVKNCMNITNKIKLLPFIFRLKYHIVLS